MISRLIAWINARVDRNVERHLTAAGLSTSPSNVRRLPGLDRCCGWDCTNELQPGDALYCATCAFERRARR